MLRATLRALLAYKLRLALSALAIVLGVAFVAGTFIFTDSLRKAFNDLTTAGQADLTIRAASSFRTDFGARAANTTVPSSLIDTLSSQPGVAEAVGFVTAPNIVVLDQDGKPVGGNAGPGSIGLGESWLPPGQLARWQLASGEAPTGLDRVVIDERTASTLGVQLGQPVSVVLLDGSTRTPTVVGIAEPTVASFGDSGSVVIWDLPAAEQLLTTPGQLTEILVTAAPGTTQDELQAQIAPLLPPDLTSQTGEAEATELSQQLDEQLGFLNTFLLVFGLIALFVSAFLIYNTFSILVAQRTQELALTRAIGATKSQVRRSVLLEAVVVALVATTAGLILGLLVAQGLRGIFSLLGAPLPGQGLVLAPRTFLISYAIGLAITVFSSLVPARRAASVPPVAAMRSDTTPATKPLRTRGIVGAVLVAVAVAFGIAALSLNLDSGTRSSALLGVSALAALFAALTLAPVASRWLIPILGWPFKRSAVGRLATENAQRNPRRTAATAGALMIGLFLITALSVVASSTIKSTDALVDELIGSDFVVFGNGFQPFPPAIQEAVADVPGVQIATAQKTAVAIVPGGNDNGSSIALVDPAQIGEVLNITMAEGSLAGLERPGTVIVDTDRAQETGLTVGSTALLTTVQGPVFAEVVGLYEPAGFFQGFTAGLSSSELLDAGDQDSAVYIKLDPDADAAQVRPALEQALAPYPIVSLQDQSEFKAQIRDQINALLTIIVALLVLAVIIAFLGIVNTLALSVFERTREIGLLRAVGTTRAQIRRMILIESVLIAVLGSVLGLVLGVIYGVALQRVLADDGISQLAINVGQLLIFLVVAALGGVLAALWPARRAAKLDVLRAIATE